MNNMLLSVKQWMVELKVIPLYVKSQINRYSNRVSRCNENSVWKMGLDISKDKERMGTYIALETERLIIS